MLRIGKVARIGENLVSTQDRLLAAIARSAEELTSGKGWPEGVLGLLEDLGRITGVSRVWIFQTIEMGDDYIIQDYPFEWADETGHAQLHMARFNMSRNDITHPVYRDMVESRKKGEWQSIIVSQLPEGWLKQDLTSQHILSMLTIPIMVEGQWWGTLGFDDCKRSYVWSDVEIALLRTASYLISNAITRDRLSAKTEQFDILRNITESSAWELDLRDGHFWCSSDIIGTAGDLRENLHMGVRDALHLLHPHDARALIRAFRTYLRESPGTFRRDLRVSADCGTYIWVEIIGRITRDRDGTPLKFAGIAVEIRKRKQEEEELRLQAHRDSLTGVGNRSLFQSEFARLCKIHGSSLCFALLLADLDYFKLVNDRLGHEAGDKALQQFAHICTENLRRSDILSRIGGEEFALLLPDVDLAEACRVSERIRKEVASTPVNYGADRFHITVSFGCVVHQSSAAVSPSELFRKADDALYEAKRTGRNRTVCKT